MISMGCATNASEAPEWSAKPAKHSTRREPHQKASESPPSEPPKKGPKLGPPKAPSCKLSGTLRGTVTKARVKFSARDFGKNFLNSTCYR